MTEGARTTDGSDGTGAGMRGVGRGTWAGPGRSDWRLVATTHCANTLRSAALVGGKSETGSGAAVTVAGAGDEPSVGTGGSGGEPSGCFSRMTRVSSSNTSCGCGSGQGTLALFRTATLRQ